VRTPLLMLLASLALAGSAAADQTATWTERKLLHFSPPALYVPENGYLTNTHFISCDQLIDRVTFVLQQLGARPGAVDQRGCHKGNGMVKSIDVTFSVLAPLDATPHNYGPPIPARWQTVELSGSDSGRDCAFLRYATIKILPLFPARNIKLISPDDCARLGVGLRAEVLKPALTPTASP